MRGFIAVAGLLLACLTGCSPTATTPQDVAPVPPALPAPAQATAPSTPTATPAPQPPPGPPAVVATGARTQPMVALTFDADMTPSALRRLQHGSVGSYANTSLIEQLRARQVPATLFLGGLWMQTYPDLTRELASDPLFELGTHSWDHPAFVPGCYGLPVHAGNPIDQIVPAQALLDELAGARSTRLFRFPGLCHDDEVLAAIAPAGVTVIDGDVYAGDGFQPDPRPIVDAVLGGVENGSIVVLHMHGGDLAPATDEAIPAIVDGLRARGFELVTVGRMLAAM